MPFGRVKSRVDFACAVRDLIRNSWKAHFCPQVFLLFVYSGQNLLLFKKTKKHCLKSRKTSVQTSVYCCSRIMNFRGVVQGK